MESIMYSEQKYNSCAAHVVGDDITFKKQEGFFLDIEIG